MKKTAIAICGPTAVGKTEIALQLAQWLETEIISFDSRQFFRELKIGAAPPSTSQLEKVAHHCIGNLSVNEDYNAGKFEEDSLNILESVFGNKNTAILVGGSGLYLQALEEGFDAIPKVNFSYRKQLQYELDKNGLNSLLDELQEKDLDYYKKVDKHNPQRVLRALEVIRGTGKSFSSFQIKKHKKKRNFEMIKIGLELPRQMLYERINQRVDKMVEMGLEIEVRQLTKHRGANAMQTVGYKEFFQYFEGEISKEDAISEIKKNTRRYAKRQMTWFRKDEKIHWFSPNDVDGIRQFLKENIYQ